MLKIAIIATSVVVLMPTGAAADEWVNGYTRSNGTYVQPHYQSSPDRSYNNNWSVQGNANPYTGSSGTAAPTYNDRSPDYNRSHYGSDFNSRGTRNGGLGY
jgi:opacity protein-like surface antigen